MVLVGTVVVHHPNFFGAAAARANEGNLRGGHAGEAAGELTDDFVGKLVGEFANLKIRGSAAIDLSDDRLSRGIAHVIEPCFDGHFGCGFGEIAEGEEIGVGGRIDPDRGFQFGRDARCLRWIEARTRNLENAGELEIVTHDLGKKGSMRFRCLGARGEVCDGEARLIGIQADRGAKPILRRRGSPTKSENHQDEE